MSSFMSFQITGLNKSRRALITFEWFFFFYLKFMVKIFMRSNHYGIVYVLLNGSGIIEYPVGDCRISCLIKQIRHCFLFCTLYLIRHVFHLFVLMGPLKVDGTTKLQFTRFTRNKYNLIAIYHTFE